MVRPALVALLLTAAVAVSTGAPASAQAPPEGSTQVSNETQYRNAVTAASSSLSPTTISLSADITVTGGADPTFTGTQPLTIDGHGHTLSGGGTRRVLFASSSVPLLRMEDLTVRDGLGGGSSGGGGGVRWNGPVTLAGVRFEDNAVVATGTDNAAGGAISTGSTTTITDSVFTGNTASATLDNAIGGAINAGGTLVMAHTTVRGNQATSTAAAANGGAVQAIDVDVTGSVFDANTAVGATAATGGALRVGSGGTIGTSLFLGNQAQGGPGGAFGGGVGAFSSVIVSDSSFLANSAESTGGAADGAALGSAEALDLTNSTVDGNVADGVGTSAVSAGELTARLTTVRRNTANPALSAPAGATLDGVVIGDPNGTNCSFGGTVTVTDSVADDGTCGATGVASIELGPPRDNGGPDLGAPTDRYPTLTDFPLAGSPVIDVVGAPCGDGLDQRGLAQPFGADCDAGAIEAVYPPHSFVDSAAWVEDAVRWLTSDVNDPRLAVGLDPTHVAVSSPILRGQVVRMLYRLFGEPDVSGYGPHPFTDVPAWVESAVRWAYGEDIVTGETPTTFAPYDPITRGQVVRMVYRVAGSQDVSGIDPHPFTDVPAWVEEAVRWAANPANPLPIVTGITATTFQASSDITRGQVARMLYRLALTSDAWAAPGSAPAPVLFQATVLA